MDRKVLIRSVGFVRIRIRLSSLFQLPPFYIYKKRFYSESSLNFVLRLNHKLTGEIPENYTTYINFVR